MNKIYDRLILGRPRVTVGVVLVISMFFGFFLKNFKLDASSDSITLENDQGLRYYDETREIFGSDDYVFVTITPTEDLMSDSTLEEIEALATDLAAVSNVSSVISILTVPLFDSPPISLEDLANEDGGYKTLLTGADREMARDELLNSPLYNDYLISKDGLTTVLQVNFIQDESFSNLHKERSQLRDKRRQDTISRDETRRLNEVEKEYAAWHYERSEEGRDRINQIREILSSYKVNSELLGGLYLGGVPMIVADIIDYVRRDIIVFGFGVIVFVLIMLTLIFRRPKWIFLPTLTCVLSVGITLGLLGLMDWRLTIVTSNLSSLLLIVTLSMAIHIIVRYRELLFINPDWTSRTLVRETVRLVAKPCLYAILTTIVGFGSLMVSGIRPVMDFGIMMVIGLSISYLVCFTFFPAAILLFPKRAISANYNSEIRRSPLLMFAHMAERRGSFILFVSFFSVILFGIGITRLKVENRFIDYFRSDTPIYQGMMELDEKLGGTTPLEVVLSVEAPVMIDEEGNPVAAERDEDGNLAEEDEGSEYKRDTSFWFAAENLEYLGKVHKYLDDLPETGKVVSLHTMAEMIRPIKARSGMLYRLVPFGRFFLDRLTEEIPEEIADSVLKPYLSEDRTQTRIAMRVRESDRSLNRKQLIADINAYFDGEGMKAYVSADGETRVIEARTTGVFVLYNNMLQSLFRSQILTIVAVIFSIWLMFLVLFRSFKLAAIAIVPNILPVILVLGTLGLLGIPLDMMTIMIAAVTFGIAVDNTIHYVHRFQKEFSKDRDYIATMYRCHTSIGRAMLYTSITFVVGFSILTASAFIPSVYFGIFTGMAMIMALLSSILLLPLLLVRLKPLGPGTKNNSGA